MKQKSLSKNLEQTFPDFEEAALIIQEVRWWREGGTVGGKVKNILV